MTNNQPELSQEQQDRIVMIEAKCSSIMESLEGMLVNDAIATLETCKGIIQARLKRIYDVTEVTKDE